MLLKKRIEIYFTLQILSLIFGWWTIYRGHNLIWFRISYLAGQSFNSHKKLETEYTFLAISDSYEFAMILTFIPIFIYLILYLINKYDKK